MVIKSAQYGVGSVAGMPKVMNFAKMVHKAAPIKQSKPFSNTTGVGTMAGMPMKAPKVILKYKKK